MKTSADDYCVPRNMNTLCCMVCVGLALYAAGARAWVDADMHVAGEYNGWSNAVNFMTKDTLALPVWKLTVQITNSADDEYVFNNWGWGNKWVDGGMAKNSAVGLKFYNNGLGTNNVITAVQPNYYYTFRLMDNGYSNTVGVVMETSDQPVAAAWQGDSLDDSGYAAGRSYTAGSNYLVYCALGAERPPEQKVYLRYTLDDWNTSHLKDITAGSQTVVTGSFVASYGQTLKYYLMTSSAEAAALAAHPDLCTLTHDTRTGANYEITGTLADTNTAFAPGQYTAPGLSWGFGVFNQFRPTTLYGGNENYWSCTLYHVTNSHEFKVTFGPDWSVNWGANSTNELLAVAPNVTNTGYRLFDSANLSFDGAWGTDAVAHIMCYAPHVCAGQLPFGVQKLTDVPTEISALADDITSPERQRLAGAATLVTAHVARATLLPEEHLYLRFTSNEWQTHFVVPMSNAAAGVYVATLPAMSGASDNMITTEYYVLTSTMSEADLGAGNNQYVDLLTVAYKLGPGDKNARIYTIPEPAGMAAALLAFVLARRRAKAL